MNLLGPRGKWNAILLCGTTKGQGNSMKVSTIQAPTLFDF